MIKEMLAMQQKLNDKTNGFGWENGLTKDGIGIYWKRYMNMECAELIASYPYAHWKYLTVPADYDNVRMECVDLAHFLWSDLLAEDYGLNDNKDILANMIQSSYNSAITLTDGVNFENSVQDQDRIIQLTEDLQRSILIYEPSNVIVEKFFMLMLHSGLLLEDLYKLYIGKNVLNIFRQDNGYKGTDYIKDWDGKEDNDYLHKVLDEHGILSPDALYNMLQNKYNVIKASRAS